MPDSSSQALGRELYKKLWTVAYKLRSNLDAAVYKHAVLGLSSSGFFVQSERFIEGHGGSIGDIMVFGQESNPTTWRLAVINMAIRGFSSASNRRTLSPATSIRTPARTTRCLPLIGIVSRYD